MLEDSSLSSKMEPLLQIKNLKTYFFMPEGVCKAVDGVSYSIYQDEILGIVGESGCGKSVSVLSVLRLMKRPGKIIAGKIFFQGEDLLDLSVDEMRRIRGNKISMIFQDPMTSLDPVFTVGSQISEAVILHQKLARKVAFERTVEMLRLVGISDPTRRMRDYPHELSGGMRQRVMIAIALSCRPKLLIADEPTTSLDVTIQAQVLDLMLKLKRDFKMSIILITHDLGLIAEMAQRVIVMYSGKVVEIAEVMKIFSKPLHPYTKGLLESLPCINRTKRDRMEGRRRPLKEIPGVVPNLLDLPKGCTFHPRCTYSSSICCEKEPEIKEMEMNHFVSCWHLQKEQEN